MEPKARLAIVYDRSAVSERERGAAMAGIDRFRRFGVECEGIEVSDKDAVRTVKRGERIKDIIGRKKATLTIIDLRSLTWRECLGRERPVMGIGIMGGELNSWSGADGESPVASTGLSYKDTGGVVSLRKIRLMSDLDLSMKTLSAAVAHEMGHVLGVEGHCGDERCLMRANEHIEDFVEITVMQARDLCRRCESIIASSIAAGPAERRRPY